MPRQAPSEDRQEILADRDLSEFQLVEQDGQPFDAHRLKGRVWVASFFFTRCAGSCWLLNQSLKSLHDDEVLRDVLFVSISCDPENDTLDALAEYAQRLRADPKRWFFCRGNMDEVRRIGQSVMKLLVEQQTHSDRAVLFDRAGKVRGTFLLTDPKQVAMLRQLLVVCSKEPPPGQTVERGQPSATL
jgi:protein SCO1/2